MIPLLLLLLFIQQSPELITTCVVTRLHPTVAATCDNHRTITIDNFADEDNSEWWFREVVEQPERIDSRTEVVIDKTLAVGRVLKLSRHGYPVAPCEVRRQRKLIDWQRNHPGERAPIGVSELDEDCGLVAQKFVAKVLEGLKSK